MRSLALFGVTLVVGGCSRLALVVDDAGHPIAGAQVAPAAFSPAATTNADGTVGVALHVDDQKARFVYVTAAGYEPRLVPVPESAPLRVVLRPTTRP